MTVGLGLSICSLMSGSVHPTATTVVSYLPQLFFPEYILHLFPLFYGTYTLSPIIFPDD